jgi:hypothetical protein
VYQLLWLDEDGSVRRGIEPAQAHVLDQETQKTPKADLDLALKLKAELTT